MDDRDIERALGSDVVAQLVKSVEQAFVASRAPGASTDGARALEQLMVALLAAVIAPPGANDDCVQKAQSCADELVAAVRLVRAGKRPVATLAPNSGLRRTRKPPRGG